MFENYELRPDGEPMGFMKQQNRNEAAVSEDADLPAGTLEGFSSADTNVRVLGGSGGLTEGAETGATTAAETSVQASATAGEEAATIGTDVGVDAAVETGAEVAGAALDATGILAPIGILLELGGAIFGECRGCRAEYRQRRFRCK